MRNEKQFPIRFDISDIYKIKYISEKNKRSSNKQIELIVQDFIQTYEKVNGKIEIPENNQTI